MRLQVSLSPEIREFIKASTGNYGKAKIVLQKNKFYVESAYTDVLNALLKVGKWHAAQMLHAARPIADSTQNFSAIASHQARGRAVGAVQDPVIQKARVHPEAEAFNVSAAPKDTVAMDLTRMELDHEEDDLEAEEAMRDAEQTVKAVASTSAPARDIDKELHSFEIEPSQV